MYVLTCPHTVRRLGWQSRSQEGPFPLQSFCPDWGSPWLSYQTHQGHPSPSAGKGGKEGGPTSTTDSGLKPSAYAEIRYSMVIWSRWLTFNLVHNYAIKPASEVAKETLKVHGTGENLFSNLLTVASLASYVQRKRQRNASLQWFSWLRLYTSLWSTNRSSLKISRLLKHIARGRGGIVSRVPYLYFKARR